MPASLPDTPARIRAAAGVTSEPVDAADGLERSVLIGEEHGSPNLAMRRFRLAPGGTAPKHTNEVEHVQYVLQGEYVVGIEGDVELERDGTEDRDGRSHDPRADLGADEYRLGPGDSLLIPAGAVHWYRNESDRPGEFLCVVPAGDDEIRVVDE